MKTKDLGKRIEVISEAVAGMKRHEWLKVVHAVEKKYSSAAMRLELADAEEIKQAIRREFM